MKEYQSTTIVNKTNIQLEPYKLESGIWRIGKEIYIISFSSDGILEPTDKIQHIRKLKIESCANKKWSSNFHGLPVDFETDFKTTTGDYIHTDEVIKIDFTDMELMFDRTDLSNDDMKKLYNISK